QPPGAVWSVSVIGHLGRLSSSCSRMKLPTSPCRSSGTVDCASAAAAGSGMEDADESSCARPGAAHPPAKTSASAIALKPNLVICCPFFRPRADANRHALCAERPRIPGGSRRFQKTYEGRDGGEV